MRELIHAEAVITAEIETHSDREKSIVVRELAERIARLLMTRPELIHDGSTDEDRARGNRRLVARLSIGDEFMPRRVVNPDWSNKQ